MERFSQLKEEILKRAKAANAYTKEYGRAYKSEDFAGLIEVIKDNFNFAVNNKVIDPELIEKFKEKFNENQVYCNVNVSAGYLLAWGNATVRAWGNATVRACGNATVRAWDNATVEAWGNATVEASGNAYINSYYIIECKLKDNAIYRIRSENKLIHVSDSMNIEKAEKEDF